jgi:hypothetical protein
VAAWVFYACAEGLILFLYLWGRYSEGEIGYDRTFCLIFSVLFAVGFLMANLPHRVIFPEDEKLIVISRSEQVLMPYLWCSIALFAITGANKD